MEFDVSYSFENEDQFWDELDEIVSRDCQTYSAIDDALRTYLSVTSQCRGEFVQSEYDVTQCARKLLFSELFEKHGEYIRRQIVYCLLQDEHPNVLQIAATFLLSDAQDTELTYELMNNEGAFMRLVDLIVSLKGQVEPGLHRLFMVLLYEMARLQRVKKDDLMHVDDNFIRTLFQIIEELSDDVDDPYHYPVIRVLLVLNEQFMVATYHPEQNTSSTTPLTNKVIKILASEGSKYKTFGENIILLLNRESETSLQLLTLKLLYLLFTTPSTYEYFYTNDLRVLVDILIRNLLDLPEDASSLRHTYLRVLCPLLSHTQLKTPPHYKRDEIRKMLAMLRRGQPVESEVDSPVSGQWQHFEAVDETTVRLVHRCQKIDWLAGTDADEILQTTSPILEETTSSPTSPSKAKPVPPALPAPRKLTKRNSSKSSMLAVTPYLVPHLDSARSSNASMMEMTAQTEKPGVLTPSRKDVEPSATSKKERPALPQARRSGWIKAKGGKSQDAPAKISQNEATNHHHEEEAKEGHELSNLPTVQVSSESESKADAEDMTAAQAIPGSKKPPPAPKARRWRGKGAKDQTDSAGGALRNVHFRSISNPAALAGADTDSTLTEEKSDSRDVESPKASVSSALDKAQAEAISSVTETLDRTSLGPETGSLPRVVLAPPSPAPPRSVPGPRFELEKSPFIGEDEDD